MESGDEVQNRDKVNALEETLKKAGATFENEDLYNRIDKMMSDSMRCAEKQCSKKSKKPHDSLMYWMKQGGL